MAKRSTSAPSDNTLEMQAAAELILKREESSQQDAQRRVKRKRRERRQAKRKAIEKTQQSIEVMKWCIVAICTVWIISFAISIIVLVKVQSKVTEIEGQVQRIRHVMDNPFASAGARLGRQFDDKLKETFGLSDPQDNEK